MQVGYHYTEENRLDDDRTTKQLSTQAFDSFYHRPVDFSLPLLTFDRPTNLLIRDSCCDQGGSSHKGTKRKSL
ncbi:hypothetical protein C5167_042478 [Papaver somniferum]|uniref:Uncharacterized protein n=1 Tax=Papaver somniferum TaxID=3469 RepID=A0A4Y7L2Y7_PAPSO|nr:hypothetical protein C5167_042478 [Papaver somniferum]